MLRRTLLLAAPVLLVTPARAHHGWGSYEADRPVTLRGAIKAVRFGNPHVSIDLESEGKLWECTLAPPFRMNARGADEAFVKAGAEATLYGYPSRANPSEMRAEWIEMTGKRVELR
jgi:Family of unknown function (DUF6152)